MNVLVMLRWVLIIAIAYVLLFSRPLNSVPPSVALFIALYLGSNVLLASLVRHEGERSWLEWAVVVLDVAAVTLALFMSGDGSNDLFVLYFVVLFLSALSDGIALAAGAALFIGVAHIYTASHFIDAGELVRDGYIVRIPFLFAVALFFGNVVHNSRSRQRESDNRVLRAQRMELLSTVSHDLRNPLGVIDSLTGMLLDGDAGDLNGDQAGLLQRIRVSIRQVLHLSNNLIDAERIELDNFPLRRELCDVRGIAEESLLVAGMAAELKGITLTSEFATCAALRIDSVQIERALSNLLGNAVKFSPRGGQVRLSMRRCGDHLRIEVADTGPGFPQTLLRNVGRKHLPGAESKGSGLGLFIAKAVMAAHGGWLSVENLSGRGAVVGLNLPMEPSTLPVDGPAVMRDFGEPVLAKVG